MSTARRDLDNARRVLACWAAKARKAAITLNRVSMALDGHSPLGEGFEYVSRDEVAAIFVGVRETRANIALLTDHLRKIGVPVGEPSEHEPLKAKIPGGIP